MPPRIWARIGGITALVFTMMFTVSAARANWADRLFAQQRHDFGPVPRGVTVRHPFVLVNSLPEPVTVLDVRASCGCTKGRAISTPVPPGGSTTVEAEMDTKNFVGKKSTTLYVTLVDASGREAEVRLGVSTTILSDIVLNPGTIDFGTVAKGDVPTQTLTIDRVGMPGWQVKRMVSSCRALDASLTETNRDGDAVTYVLKVSLKAGAAPGTIRDEIQLMTNDPETPAFPILVTAAVRGRLSASPGVLAMGGVKPGGISEGRFVVRAPVPFVVKSIDGDGDGFKTRVDDGTAKNLHIVTVTYRPEDGKTRGDLRHRFRLHSDLAGELPLGLTATLSVAP